MKPSSVNLPDGLPKPQCWIDAAAGDNLYTDTGATNKAQPYQAVRLIRDRGELGCHVTFPAATATCGVYTIHGSPVVGVSAPGTFAVSPLLGLTDSSGYTIVAVWQPTGGGHPFAVSSNAVLSAATWTDYINTDTSRVMPAPLFTTDTVLSGMWQKSNTGNDLTWCLGASRWSRTEASATWLSKASPRIGTTGKGLHLAELLIWHTQGAIHAMQHCSVWIRRCPVYNYRFFPPISRRDGASSSH